MKPGSGCDEQKPTLREALEPAYVLSKYAWAFRYPGAPYEPEAGEAAAGRALAERVRRAIADKLPEAVTK